ncbi:MAG: DUF3332 domain-containing protein [Bacteroidales bacterium]|jgi:hypothetical protein|nr:DUF3332 domain-containing protein [Bacteroidales bacterium]
MKNLLKSTAVLAIAGCLTLSSCIGSFGLVGKIHSWNQGIGGKWVNEVVFLAFCIVPVYEVCVLADAIVFNTIEFWSGNNPIAAGEVNNVKGENGMYAVETLENGYKITNEEGVEMKLVYDETSNAWCSVIGEQTMKLVTINTNQSATVHLSNGLDMNVDLTKDGVLALRQALEGSASYVAAK